MKRHSQSGVALVITLIMLSVITLLAVAFLGTTRRERASVTVASTQIDAKLMADAALNRAVADEISRMLVNSNLLAYDMLVSTNQDGRQFTTDGMFTTNIFNVNAVAALTRDPRVPVYINTNRGGGVNYDFRFYLDFNRNGTNEAAYNDLNALQVGDPQWIGVLEDPTINHFRTNRFVGRYAFMVLPTGKSLDVNFVHNYAKHISSTIPGDGYLRNQGVGTWEFNLAGFLTELDPAVWNYSAANLTNLTTGTGSGLTNDSFLNSAEIVRYRYATNYAPASVPSFNLAYPSANAQLLFAQDNIDGYTDGPLMTGSRLLTNEFPASITKDTTTLSWPGARNPNVIADAQELIDANRRARYPIFQDTLRAAMVPANNFYDRTTLYRLLAQMGTDSTLTPSLQTVRSLLSTNTVATAKSVAHGLTEGDYVEIRGATPADYNGVYAVTILNANTFQYPFGGTGNTPASGVLTMRRVKINLNYDNIVQTNFTSGLATATNFLTWKPEDFFRVVGDRLLQMSKTNAGGKTYIGGYEVSPNLSITNIPLYPTNEYNPSVHRLLQLAANLFDATTNTAVGTVMPSAGPGFPTVFQPIISKSAGLNVSVVGYQEVSNSLPVNHVLNRQIYDISEFASNSVSPGLYTDRILYGVPLVIGAKKGYPNFNEFSMLLSAQGIRKIQVVRPNANSLPNETNVMFMLSISNQVGLEVWNSYSNAFPRPTVMFAQVSNRFVLTNDRYAGFSVRGGVDSNNFGGPGFAIPANFFGPTNFVFPFSVGSNMSAFLTNSTYRVTGGFAPNGGFVPVPYNVGTNAFERAGFIEPQWSLDVSNRVFYALVDQAANRIVDFVAMSGFGFNTNLSAGFTEEPAGGAAPGGQNYARLLWDPTRIGGPTGPTQGMDYQIQVSKVGGPDPAPPYDWRTFANVPTNKEAGRQAFTDFLTRATWPGEQLQMQAPYQALGECGRVFSWQVNDPLVHYMVEDFLNPYAGAGSYSREKYPVVLNPALFISAINSRGTATPKVVSLTTPEIGIQIGGLGRVNIRYKPWKDPQQTGAPGYAFNQSTNNLALQDPMVTRSDDWDFPQGKLGNIGWIGRVHRGTPWQTVYFKSKQVDDEAWRVWVGRDDLSPTNDWRLPDVLTTAIDPNSVRGLLSINQTNSAAWAAALAGVGVLSNSTDWYIDPGSPQFKTIYSGIQNVRTNLPSQVFTNISQLLSVPELTVASPFLDPVVTNEVAMERLPQQLFSLLTVEEVPRITVYAWGQSLKPAPQSLFNGGGTNFQLCTNYQITGEVATRTVLRIEGTTNAPRAVVESYTVLPNP